MDLLTEKQVSELIVVYENRVKALIEKIKGELQNRKELKKKFAEAKQREALLLQILERLDESEKVVKKQLDLVAKMEDSESLKKLEFIKRMEQVVNEQQNVWKQYKEEYESLPLVKEVRKAETKLLCTTIKYRLEVQKMKDAQRMVQLREMVRKKQEQNQIIKFAEMYVEHMKRQKRCEELWEQNKKLRAQAQQLRLALQEKEKADQQKLDIEREKASALMKPQQLPQVDLSHFIIHREKGNDKLDTMSINSYMLEEEYMNNNGQSNSKLNSSQNKAMDVDNQDSLAMDMDIQKLDSQEGKLVQSNESPRRLDFKGAFDNGDQTPCIPSNSSNQSASKVSEHNGTPDQTVNSQESHSEMTRKRMNQNQQENKENVPMDTSFTNNRNNLTICSTPHDRPIPTPAKTTKISFQEKHPRQQTFKPEINQHQYQQEMSQQNQNQQVSKRSLQETQQQNQFQQLQNRSPQEMMQQQQPSSRHQSQEMYQQQQVYQQNQQQQQSWHPTQEMYQQQNLHQQEMQLRNQQRQASQQQSQPMQVSPQNSEQIDFSRLPSNKPRVISNEYVNYDLQNLQRKQMIKIQPNAEPPPRTSTETPTARSTSALSKAESTPFAYQVPFAMGHQSSVNVTPMSAAIEPSSMMSTTMHSVDNYFPDNISAILGSEITESGGSIELRRRFYGETDSESGDFDMDEKMKNLLSPLHKISPKVQRPQAPENTSTQPPSSSSINQNTENSNSNDRAFMFGGFTKKETNTTQRFF